jgi:hypothetical protein
VTNLRERRRNLLNLTITEIILIILFLVLLIAGSLIKKNKELRDQNQIYKNLDVDALQLAEFQKFKELISELNEKNGEFADMDIDEIVAELVLAKEKYQEIKDKESEIAKLMDKLKDYEKAKELLAYYKEKYGNDKPPCWKKTGTVAKPEYLFDAIINDSGIILKNTDSRYPHRVVDRKNLPLSNVMEGKTISINQFLKQTLSVYELNKEICRHYILIDDEMLTNDKNHWNAHEDAIENHFYKFNNN